MNPDAWYVAVGMARLDDRDRKLAKQQAQSRASQPRRKDTRKGRRP